MQNSSALKATHTGHHRGPWDQIRSLLFRKLWLPRIVYEILPYFYLLVGFIALFSALRVPGDAWIIAYAGLLAIVCLHLGVAIITLRYRYRRGRKAGSRTRFRE